MLAVNYTNLRNNIKMYMDKVTDDYETMIVTRKDNKNIVMLSEESYNNLMENIYVMGNKANYDWLMESKTQLEKGNISCLAWPRFKMVEAISQERIAGVL